MGGKKLFCYVNGNMGSDVVIHVTYNAVIRLKKVQRCLRQICPRIMFFKQIKNHQISETFTVCQYLFVGLHTILTQK